MDSNSNASLTCLTARVFLLLIMRSREQGQVKAPTTRNPTACYLFIFVGAVGSCWRSIYSWNPGRLSLSHLLLDVQRKIPWMIIPCEWTGSWPQKIKKQLPDSSFKIKELLSCPHKREKERSSFLSLCILWPFLSLWDSVRHVARSAGQVITHQTLDLTIHACRLQQSGTHFQPLTAECSGKHFKFLFHLFLRLVLSLFIVGQA